MSVIQQKNNSPKQGLKGYQRVRQAVEEYIRTHNLQSGDRIPTEAELCRKLGWSRPTITRALNEMAEEGVLERIQGSGTFLTQPASTSGYCIIISTPWTEEPGGYTGSLFAGIRQEAAKQALNIKYHLSPTVVSPDEARQQGADGVLVASPWLGAIDSIMKLMDAGIPVVGMPLYTNAEHLPMVCTYNYGGIYSAVDYLYGMGHKRIAYVLDYMATSDVCERILGFQNAMSANGLQVDRSHLLAGETTISQEYFEYWFENLAVLPTAILSSIRLVVPLLRLMSKRNLRMPEDISLIVTDDPKLDDGLGSSFTCVHQPVFALGQRGMEKLIDIICGRDSGKQEVITARLIKRDSVVPPSA